MARAIALFIFFLAALALSVLEPGAVLAAKGANHGANGAAPLTLPRALHLAQGQSESFQLLQEQWRQARLARDRAWSAFLPVIQASGSFTHSDREVAFQDRVFQKQDSFSGQISGTMTLLRGPAMAELAAAYRALAAQREQVRWDRTLLLYEVAQAFYAALAAQQLVRAAEHTLELGREHLEAVKARRAAGQAIRVDETRARLEVVAARGDVQRSRTAWQGSLDYLGFLMGQDAPRALVSPPSPAQQARQTAAQPNEPPGRRPDLLAAQHGVVAARRQTVGSWLEYLPTLSVTGTYRGTQNTGFSGDPDSWDVVLTLDWVLFNAGLREVQRKEAASRLQESKLKDRQLRRQAALQRRQAGRDLRSAAVTLQTTEEQLRLAQENRDLVLSRFRAGLATSLEQVEADEDLRQAQVALVSAQLDLSLRALDVLRTAGLDPLGKPIAKP